MDRTTAGGDFCRVSDSAKLGSLSVREKPITEDRKNNWFLLSSIFVSLAVLGLPCCEISMALILPAMQAARESAPSGIRQEP